MTDEKNTKQELETEELDNIAGGVGDPNPFQYVKLKEDEASGGFFQNLMQPVEDKKPNILDTENNQNIKVDEAAIRRNGRHFL